MAFSAICILIESVSGSSSKARRKDEISNIENGVAGQIQHMPPTAEETRFEGELLEQPIRKSYGCKSAHLAFAGGLLHFSFLLAGLILYLIHTDGKVLVNAPPSNNT